MKKRMFRAVGLVLLATCVVAVRVRGGQQPNLRGTVVDVAGARIPNAQVDLYSDKHEWHATTDGAGSFSFPALLPGIYDLEVTRTGFRKQIIQSIRIGPSEISPMTIAMQVSTSADSCGDSFSRVMYLDSPGEFGIKGVVSFVSHREVTENGGKKRAVSSAGLLSGATVSVLRSGSKDKPTTVQTDENGEFEFADLEPGLYLLRASREGYADFAVSNVRVRLGKTLEVQFSMQPSGYIVVCQ